jgi:tetratricopeptide (TPR) repeat protein
MHDKQHDSLSPNAKELLKFSKIKSPICGQDADEFFAQLMSGLGLGKPEWMKAPINTLLCNAARIAEVENSDIKTILADYRAHIEQLEKCGQTKPQRSKAEEIMLRVSELRLKGEDKEAADYLRANIKDIDSAEAWRQLGEIEIEIGKYQATPDRLKQAIEAFQNSIKKLDRHSAPLEWAATQCSLSEALWRLGGRESATEKLELSTKICRDTLDKTTRSDNPLCGPKYSATWALHFLLLENGKAEQKTWKKR